MRISAKADYAIRALVELAADVERPLTCEGMASSQDIPYRFLKSVLYDLRRAGLLRSQRGCEGGYWLGRDPAAITLAEVVLAVDGRLTTVHGEDPGTLAYPSPAEHISTLWRAIKARTDEILSGVTIADLVTAAPTGSAAVLLAPGRAAALA